MSQYPQYRSDQYRADYPPDQDRYQQDYFNQGQGQARYQQNQPLQPHGQGQSHSRSSQDQPPRGYDDYAYHNQAPPPPEHTSPGRSNQYSQQQQGYSNNEPRYSNPSRQPDPYYAPPPRQQQAYNSHAPNGPAGPTSPVRASTSTGPYPAVSPPRKMTRQQSFPVEGYDPRKGPMMAHRSGQPKSQAMRSNPELGLVNQMHSLNMYDPQRQAQGGGYVGPPRSSLQNRNRDSRAPRMSVSPQQSLYNRGVDSRAPRHGSVPNLSTSPNRGYNRPPSSASGESYSSGGQQPYMQNRSSMGMQGPSSSASSDSYNSNHQQSYANRSSMGMQAPLPSSSPESYSNNQPLYANRSSMGIQAPPQSASPESYPSNQQQPYVPNRSSMGTQPYQQTSGANNGSASALPYPLRDDFLASPNGFEGEYSEEPQAGYTANDQSEYVQQQTYTAPPQDGTNPRLSQISANKIPPAATAVVSPVTPTRQSAGYSDYRQGESSNGTTPSPPQQSPERYGSVSPRKENVAAVAPGQIEGYSNESMGEHQDPELQEPLAQKPLPQRQYNTPPPPVKIEKPSAPKVITVNELESLRQHARLSPSDNKLQLEFAKKLVEASYVLADQYLDPQTPASASAAMSALPGSRVDEKTERKNREVWIAQAYKTVKRLASSNDPEAIFYLASNYGSGRLGLDVDYDKAYELYTKAAKLNHGESAYRVAVCNEIGAGTRRDPQKAITWYRKAGGQLGDVSAMYKLGMISLNGLLGQPRNQTEAITWLLRASDNATEENPHALHELGLLCERGELPAVSPTGAGLPASKEGQQEQALEYFTRAAELNYAPSQFRLGSAYEYGTLGCAVDPERSIAWYTRASQKGEPESELAMSGWYLTGSNGILAQSDTEAYLWAQKAANKNLAKAQYAMGYYTEVGIGVRPDLELAKQWYFKAAAQRHPKALARLQDLRATDQQQL